MNIYRRDMTERLLKATLSPNQRKKERKNEHEFHHFVAVLYGRVFVTMDLNPLSTKQNL